MPIEEMGTSVQQCMRRTRLKYNCLQSENPQTQGERGAMCCQTATPAVSRGATWRILESKLGSLWRKADYWVFGQHGNQAVVEGVIRRDHMS